jgi:apolipoprotein N-acyltransferase
MWLMVVLLSLVSGVLAGMSFANPDFWMHPVTGVFCLSACLVLAGTLWALTRVDWKKT